MTIKNLVCLGTIACTAFFSPAHASGPAFHVAERQGLPGEVKWDYLTFDGASHRLFITHGDRVDVYDTEERKVIGSIGGTLGVHGVALAPDIDRGYTSNGQSSTVTVFELSSLRVLGTLPTEKKPDAIVYDPFSKRVFVANGDSGTLTVIDAPSGKLLATVAVGGKLEFQAVDAKGLLYVNVEDKNVLAVVDTAKLKVIAQHDITAGCKSPTGLSIDPSTDRLFVGCRNQKMAVVAGETGAILASLPIGKGCDATAYDPGLKQAYASNGDGTLTVISSETYSVEQIVTTQATAKTMALDASKHRIYAVAAEIEVPASAGVRQKLRYDSFMLLTLTQ